MDPGHKLLEHIKTIPNLIDEDPSITTPKNTSFMDLSWAQLSALLNQKQSKPTTGSKYDDSTMSDSIEDDESANDSLWDANTGYQFLDKSNTASPIRMHGIYKWILEMTRNLKRL
ncbi:hypothetical protein BCR42DRAFT_430703 [Absidia repens]|uniref:Uncharacterized protein n=1 Tax=Absidia repens TaxID=90262 RepID=A0A1X2IZQ6_9FUNG|nr:hypothetical protein BCR42DRAFT_430703 [Absidia repens]